MNSMPPNRAGMLVGEDKNLTPFNMSMTANY